MVISINLGNVEIYTTRVPIITPIRICLQRPDIGPCKARIERYYFDVELGSCEIFFWGGCAGNQNRFKTRNECERTCSFYRPPMISNHVN